jgi:hypothetical protein
LRHFIALIAVPVLAMLWTVGLGVMAARHRAVAGRILFAALALAGAVFAAAGWYLLITAVAD